MAEQVNEGQENHGIPRKRGREGGYRKGRGAQIQVDNPFEHHVYEDIEDGHWAKHSEGSGEEPLPTKYVRVHPKSIVNKVDSPDIPLYHSLNPYQGCEHGCVYCYARNSHEFWGYNAGLDFERFILIKEDAPKLLEKKILSGNWKVEPIMLSGNTDCYQPAEFKLQITRRLLEVFARYRHPVGIITKNSLILRDMDILQDLAKDNLVHVSLSITGTDEELRRKMEPRTASYEKRFRTVEHLSNAGIPVNIMMAPVIPALNSGDIMEVARRGSDAGALDLAFIMVRLNGRIGLVFRDWLEKNFPDRAAKVISQVEALHGGKINDSRFGVRMRGEGKIASIIHQQFKVARQLYYSGRRMPEYNRNAFRGRQLSLF
jgi:DNA repair photolyase